MSLTGDRLGRYELRGTLGSGSFAVVYRARDPLLEREVALKALLPHLSEIPEDRERFLGEARALAALHHLNIVTVYDVGEAGGRPFFAMELVEGQTLADLVRAGPIPVAQALAILAALASAIDAVHRAGLVHRDIKDSNVMLTDAGRVVLMDFGIAIEAGGRRRTATGAGLGTPETASPEQIRGETIGPAADMYALGVLAYQLFGGRMPFTGDTAHVLYAQAHLPPPPLRTFRPGLPEPIYRAIEMALEKDAARRPTSAGAFISMLTGAALTSGPFPTGDAEDIRPMVASGPVAQHVEGSGDLESAPLVLRKGFTTFRFRHEPTVAAVFRVSLRDGEGKPLKQLVQAHGTYSGMTAYTASGEGRYSLSVQARGRWHAEVEQPDLASIQPVTSAVASADSVVYLALEQGVRRLLITHQVWNGTLFRVTLLDGSGERPDRLISTTGPYRGPVTRKIAASGTHILVVEAEGAWTVEVK